MIKLDQVKPLVLNILGKGILDSKNSEMTVLESRDGISESLITVVHCVTCKRIHWQPRDSFRYSTFILLHRPLPAVEIKVTELRVLATDVLEETKLPIIAYT